LIVNEPSQKLKIKLSSNEVALKAIEISDIRISEKQKQAALTVEAMDLIAIKEVAGGNFYEGLANLKGVDITAASLGFKVINTRGFNSTNKCVINTSEFNKGMYIIKVQSNQAIQTTKLLVN